MIAFYGVDSDRVYLMGYSAGGDGVYQVAPRMADRFAAAAMMAGMIMPMLNMAIAEAVENVDSCIADPTEGVDNLFAQLDTNEDGTIVKQEWLDNGHLLFSTPDVATEVQDALKFADDGAVDTNDDCCIM